MYYRHTIKCAFLICCIGSINQRSHRWHFNIFVFEHASLLHSRASSTSSLWSGWTRCLRAPRAYSTTPFWWCVKAVRAVPAWAAAWGPVFQGASPCSINTFTTTATWTLRRLVGEFYFILCIWFYSLQNYNLIIFLRRLHSCWVSLWCWPCACQLTTPTRPAARSGATAKPTSTGTSHGTQRGRMYRTGLVMCHKAGFYF